MIWIITLQQGRSDDALETYIVSLDSKNRMVLPLEIRDSLALNKKSNNKVKIKVFRENNSYLFRLNKAKDVEGKRVSKNCWLL